MKGLAQIPSQKDLRRSYDSLQATRKSLAEKDLALLSQWTRFDPRLMEQLISHFSQYWSQVSPVRLNQEIGKQVWPACLAVCLEQARFLIEKDRALYKNWMNTCLTEMQPLAYQSYFIGLRPIASPQVQAAALHPVRPFEKWGFAEAEIQINKIRNYPAASFSKNSRENLLRQMTATKKRFSVEDYLEVCRHSISTRQAQRDLQSFPWVKSCGLTKARYYLA